ncbi:DUF1178 family protein [Sphingomonas sp. CARO-RG-8B-R24-01]|uniref:DUF1178 family protein n=1 Tax=Sphingomonas sp. CARO-RG-8B-R24-01 TaxID=2914831 RepID=UPI001F57D95D|nr:DUF1178 family protein [Sphingomonas sp. CARO-RG-8B-R24-01]
MIVFDLQCASAHVFEAWFGSGAAFEDQQARGLLACPLCGDARVIKAVMAPNVGVKGNRGADSRSTSPTPKMPPPAEIKAALKALAATQAHMVRQSTWVGRGFADQARAMHDGVVEQSAIHGAATLAEAKALHEDGVPIMPLPFPLLPPETVN